MPKIPTHPHTPPQQHPYIPNPPISPPSRQTASKKCAVKNNELQILTDQHNKLIEDLYQLITTIQDQYNLAVHVLTHHDSANDNDNFNDNDNDSQYHNNNSQYRYGMQFNDRIVGRGEDNYHVYSVNFGLVHLLRNGVQDMRKSLIMLRSNVTDNDAKLSAYLMYEEPNPLLISASQQLQISQPQAFLQKHRYSSQITLSKSSISSQFLHKLHKNCQNLYTLHLHSDPLDQKSQIQDIDIPSLSLFSNISILDLKNSAITDSSIETIRDQFHNLRNLDLTGCYMLTERGVRLVADCRLVVAKLNFVGAVRPNSLSELVRGASQLNYLQIKGCQQIGEDIFMDIYLVYKQCSTTLKWLQITSNYGMDLYINKLSYLTSQNPLSQLIHSDLHTLIGSHPPPYTGIYFENCQQLTKQSIQLIIQKCPKLQRLAFYKFINLTDRLVRDITLVLKELRVLELGCCWNITDNALYYLGVNLDLEYLSLEKCYGVTDAGLGNIVGVDAIDGRIRKKGKSQPKKQKQGHRLQQPNPPNNSLPLTHLNISNCSKLTDTALLLLTQHTPNLKYLNLSNCDQITDISIEAISQKLLKLEYLNLNCCQRLTDSSISMVATRMGRKLRVLEIEWCQISQHCVRLIVENLGNLRVLNLSYCPAVVGEEIEVLAKNIPKIQTLKLQSNPKIPQNSFIKLSSLRQVKTLCVKQCSEISDTFIKLLTTNNRNLEYLDISWCVQITDHALFSIAKNCYVLRHLNLNGCVGIGDQGLQWLSATVSNIQYLNLTLCSKLSDTGIMHITNKLRSLKSLYMCQLQQLTDVSITSISNLDKLQQLILLGCTGITNSSLVGLMYNLQKLHELNISKCRSVEGKYLKKICRFLTNIKILEISQIQVNDQFLDQLALYCQKLVYVNLCYCQNITDGAVMKLLERLPRLEKIDIQNTNITEQMRAVLFHALSARRMHNVILE